MSKKTITLKQYANICLNCPYESCKTNYTGECDRVKPFKPEIERRNDNAENSDED